ncbi:MAG: hypothetical protein AAB649_03940, partial [Patescibacteria group bacterium]
MFFNDLKRGIEGLGLAPSKGDYYVGLLFIVLVLLVIYIVRSKIKKIPSNQVETNRLKVAGYEAANAVLVGFLTLYFIYTGLVVMFSP